MESSWSSSNTGIKLVQVVFGTGLVAMVPLWLLRAVVLLMAALAFIILAVGFPWSVSIWRIQHGALEKALDPGKAALWAGPGPWQHPQTEGPLVATHTLEPNPMVWFWERVIWAGARGGVPDEVLWWVLDPGPHPKPFSNLLLGSSLNPNPKP